MPKKEKKALVEDPHRKIIKLRFAKVETFSFYGYLNGNWDVSVPQFRLAQRNTFSLLDYWYGNWGISRPQWK